MIQFNLLPDVKQQFINAKRQKRLINFLAFAAAGVSITLLILFFSFVQIAQKKHMSDLNGDIKKYTDQLKSTPDLDKVLTIQNQLKSLPQLFASRPSTSRLFGYIGQLTPAKVSIAKFDVDFSANTFDITGSADSLETINKYVDTFKFTTYTTDADTTTQNQAFKGVVLSGFNRDSKAATYEITLTFDPGIFDGSKAVKLNVPNQITTRSETEQPLFNGEQQPVEVQPKAGGQ
jgi:hypothetical protein